MNAESETPILTYANADLQRRSPLLGRIATILVLVAGIIGIVSFLFELDLGGLISFFLGAIGLILGLVAVARTASRTHIAWIAIVLSIMYWVGAVMVEAYLGNLGG
jgi:hypothetical protein